MLPFPKPATPPHIIPATRPASLPDFITGYRPSGATLDGGENVTAWPSITAQSAFALTPPGSSPATRRYWFGGYRGVRTQNALSVDTPLTITRPWEVWVSFEMESLATNQRLIQSADASSDILQVTSTGALRFRINNSNKDATPTGTIVASTKYVARVSSDAAGAITAEVNGTTHDQSVSSTDTWEYGRMGHTGASVDGRIGAFHLYDSELSDGHRAIVRDELDAYRNGTVATSGLSNTWDALQGWETAGGVHMFHSASGFNNNAMKDWFDNIGNTGITPWVTLINEMSITGSGGHPFCDRIWFYMGLAVADAATDDATIQSWAVAILAEIRAQMDSIGHDGANAVCYASHMADYGPDVACTIVSSGAWQKMKDLHDWAIGGGLTNCVVGPVLPDIVFSRADDGDPTSPCHVEEASKVDDGQVLKAFFGS